MKMTFRWYGDDDKVTLDYIKQIPGMHGIVTAIYDVPVGQVWPLDKILALKEKIESKGLAFETIESVPVHEDIKMGLLTKDLFIKNYCETLRNLSKAGIKVVLYNFMPVFDWTRSELAHELPDGSNALIYVDKDIQKMNPVTGELSLPGWDSSYTKQSLNRLLNQYAGLTEEMLWDNLKYFLNGILKTAEEVGIKMAIHPDDPPWSIFGLPRIIKNKEAIERLLNLVDSPSNGLAICTGSLGASPSNDMPDILNTFAARGKVFFAHVRNVKHTGEKSFEEAAHKSSEGSLDMVAILKALHDNGYEGYIRPDHGRMIWGETGRPGYGLYDRALGVMYMHGIWETLDKCKK